jgi:hypothetical protein
VLLTVGRAEHLPSDADLNLLRLRPQQIWFSGERAPSVGNRDVRFLAKGCGEALAGGIEEPTRAWAPDQSTGIQHVVVTWGSACGRARPGQNQKSSASTDVLCNGVAVAASPPRSRDIRRESRPAADDGGYEQWPYLDEEVLVASRSRKVCVACHWFRHHGGRTSSLCSPASCTKG